MNRPRDRSVPGLILNGIRWRSRRVLMSLNPLRIAQGVVVWFNFGPFLKPLRALYGLGLRRAVCAISRHSEVHAIYGTGSFFSGRCLYGHSDVDLVIVLREGVKRSDGAHQRIGRSYRVVQRVFPFLGGWDEKEGSLVFLDEVAAGFNPHATVRIRRALGHHHRLCGDPYPAKLDVTEVSAADWVSDIGRLVRWALISGERTTSRLLFWQRMFSKLEEAADGLGQRHVLEQAREELDLGFMTVAPRSLFFRSAVPRDRFGQFQTLADKVLDGVTETSEPVRVSYQSWGGKAPTLREVERPSFIDIPEVEAVREVVSGPIGFVPQLFYFSVDEPILLAEITGDTYVGVRSLVRHMKGKAGVSDAVIARAEGSLYLLCAQDDFVDLLQLDPLLHANLYARLDGALEFDVPAVVLESIREEADGLFDALRGAYHRHMGWLPKHSYAAIYREDDLDTIRDALDILAAWVAHTGEGVVFEDSFELIECLSARYPRSADFLEAMLEYRRFLDLGGRGEPPANNLYRCLHQFVAEVLGGVTDIEVSDFNHHIGITVGIVTRNRAPDLVNALESLTAQSRRPDEVIVVDNGSTDHTKQVVAGFEQRLPLRYMYLADASIPLARNVVVDSATQEVISFTDDDCAISPEWLSSVERGFLRADNVGIVGGWVEHWPAEVNTMVDTYYEIFHNHKT